MYKFKKQEFDLTPEEQEKAKFIVKTADAKNKEWASGLGQIVSLEKGAFEKFKYQFFVDLKVRLGDYPTHIVAGDWSISSDGKKAIKIEVIKC